MARLKFTIFYSLLICITTACSSTYRETNKLANPHLPVSKQLYDTIAHMDSLLFDAFNKRDLEKQKLIFASDLEFYHDQGGLTNYNQVIENSRRLFEQNNSLTRMLIPGSLEVYPIKDYGAIQIGMHQFCHKENGKDDCGTFKFIHIWQKRIEGWKLTRIISYDH